MKKKWEELFPSTNLQKWPYPEAGVLLVVLVLLLFRLGSNELGSADEATHAQVAREMARDGHWLYPTCRGEPYFEKPPLKFWLTSLTFLVAGDTEWTARLGSALFGLGSVWGVMRLGNLLFNRRVGLAAGLVLVTTWEFLFNHCSRTGELDSALLCFSVLSVMAFWKVRMEGSPGHLYAAAVWLALGFLTKGHLALLPLLWLPLVWWIKPRFQVRDEREEEPRPEPRAFPILRLRHWVLSCALFLVIAAPWFILQIFHYGRFYLDYMFRHNLAGYVLGQVEKTWAPSPYFATVQYYFEQVLWLDYPWPPMVVLGGLMFFCRKLTLEFAHIQAARLWLLAWTAVTILVFAFSKTKLPWYHLPILIPMALMAGLVLERWWKMAANPKMLRGWNELWLGLHLGLFFFLTGFAVCLWAWARSWQQYDLVAVANYGYYFLHDPHQRSVLVAMVMLPAGLLGWLVGGSLSVSFARIRVMLFLSIPVAFALFEDLRPGDSEKAAEITQEVLSHAHLGSKGLVSLHLFDAYREQAPHYLVSPSLYYYLNAQSGILIRPHLPDPDLWEKFVKTTHPPWMAIIPANWVEDDSFRKAPFISLQKIRNTYLVYLPLRNHETPESLPNSPHGFSPLK